MKRTYVPPGGNPEAQLAICGEQPGQTEVRRGEPFVGPAGMLLDECLQMSRITRHSLYLTNVIKDLDKPLRAYINIDPRGNSSITNEGWEYITELGKELSSMRNLNAVLATGNIPLLALCSRTGITKWRGSILESTLVPGLKVIPCFHPATVIAPKFNYLNQPLIVSDLRKAYNESKFKEIRRSERKAIIKPSFNRAMSYLNHCCELGRGGKTIDLDIEVINGEVDCISFAFSSTESICIPFRYQQGDYFTVDQEYEIMLKIAEIIEDENIAKRGANFIFDTQFLFSRYGIKPNGTLHCTQIAQKIAYPDFKAGLDFVTTMHTDIPYYKQDGKKWMKLGAGSWEEWWNYNCMDTMATAAAHPKQIQELIKQQNLDTYERQRKLIKPLIYMAERGIKIDVGGMVECKESEQSKLDEISEELYKEVGYQINYNSPQQLMKYFYSECRIKPYKKKNAQGKWVQTTDVDALKRISRRNIKGSRVAQLMLDIRSLTKRISTYLDISKVEQDARYRSSYKPVGAETGRLASGETIFGTGGNQQNWPHDLLQYFMFDEGYFGYSIDLSQIENRIVAYVGGVIEQIKAFERGVDLHRLTASIIFNKPYQEILTEDGSSPLGDGRQSERYWGKKGNHATNYDVQYRTFALKNEMSETDAKNVLERIHRGYPQIRGGYHVTIQNMLLKDRYVTNLFGRKRLFLGPIKEHYPHITKYAVANTYREAYAQLPQSTTADKINEQGLEYIYYNPDLFGPVELLAQIHDSVVFQIPLSVPWIEHARMLLLIKQSLERPLYWHDREIPTPADISIGYNMCKEDMKELKSKDVPSDKHELADKLERIYKELCLQREENSVTG